MRSSPTCKTSISLSSLGKLVVSSASRARRRTGNRKRALRARRSGVRAVTAATGGTNGARIAFASRTTRGERASATRETMVGLSRWRVLVVEAAGSARARTGSGERALCASYHSVGTVAFAAGRALGAPGTSATITTGGERSYTTRRTFSVTSNTELVIRAALGALVLTFSGIIAITTEHLFARAIALVTSGAFITVCACVLRSAGCE